MSTEPAPPDPSNQDHTSAHDSNTVNVRVTYLHDGNPRPPHELGRLPADTTIRALKARLQSELLEGPRPEEQRLIYQGRPLLQDDLNLREALRLSGPIGPLPYTIHIIIQPRVAASHFRPDPSANGPTSPVTNAGQPGLGTVMPGGQAQMPLNHQQINEQTERMQAVAIAQMNLLQQQLQAMGQPTGGATIHINGQPIHPARFIPGAHAQPGPNATMNNSAEQQRLPPQANTALPQELPNPVANNVPNAGQQTANAPFRRPLSVPPPPRLDAAPHPFHVHQHPHNPMIVSPAPLFGYPIPHLGATMHQAQHQAQHQPTETTVWLASSRNGPEALLFAPGHGYFSSRGAAANANQVNPLSMPFAAVRNNSLATLAPTPTQNARPDPRPNNQGQQPAAGPVVQRRPLQRAPAARARARALNDDFMGLIIQRGWLFLRLYMFMFVLSEPGTWRRYLLLGLAVIICLLPRQNPLNQLMVAARRHIDNLIGPPEPQRPAPAAVAAAAQPQHAQPGAPPAARAPAGAGAVPPPAVRGAVNITPEQAAARILETNQQQQPQQPPNVIRDTFYRIEQAVALFLASLIPGVGERHVQARAQTLADQQERLRLLEEQNRARREEMQNELRQRGSELVAEQRTEPEQGREAGGHHSPEDNRVDVHGSSSDAAAKDRRGDDAVGTSTGVDTAGAANAGSSVAGGGAGGEGVAEQQQQHQVRERTAATPTGAGAGE